MDKLKARLEPLKLSDEQKKRMLTQLYTPKKQFALIPIIMPAFVAVALLLIVLNMLPSLGTTTASTQSLFTTEPLSTRYIVLTIISSLEVIAAYFLMKATLAGTKRWQQNATLQEIYALCLKWPLVVITLMVVVSVIWLGLFYFANRWYVEGVFIGCTYVVLLFVLLHAVKNMEKATCPHCQTPLTRRQIIVKASMQYRERCNSCKNLIYLTRQSKQQMFSLFIWPVMPLWIGNMASLHNGMAVILAILNIATIVYLYIPVMVEFTKENTDPEKFS